MVKHDLLKVAGLRRKIICGEQVGRWNRGESLRTVCLLWPQHLVTFLYNNHRKSHKNKYFVLLHIYNMHT